MLSFAQNRQSILSRHNVMTGNPINSFSSCAAGCRVYAVSKSKIVLVGWNIWDGYWVFRSWGQEYYLARVI